MGFVLQFLHFLLEVTKTKILKRFGVLKWITQMRLTRESEVSECKCGGRTFLLPAWYVAHVFPGGSTVLFLCTSAPFQFSLFLNNDLLWVGTTWHMTERKVDLTHVFFFLQASYMCAQGSSISSLTKKKYMMKEFILKLHSKARNALLVFFHKKPLSVSAC